MQLEPSGGSHHFGHLGGEIFGSDDPGRHRVLEVMAYVGDAVGPGHYLALGGHRGGAVPGVVADGVERLHAQVEWFEHDVGPVHGVVVSPVQIGRQGTLRRMAGGAVAAVVAGGRCRGQGNVQTHRPGDGHRHLADLDGMGESGAKVVVVGGDEHLALAGQPPERLGVLDAVEVAFETGPEPVRGFDDCPVAGSGGAGRSRCEV